MSLHLNELLSVWFANLKSNYELDNNPLYLVSVGLLSYLHYQAGPLDSYI